MSNIGGTNFSQIFINFLSSFEKGELNNNKMLDFFDKNMDQLPIIQNLINFKISKVSYSFMN